LIEKLQKVNGVPLNPKSSNFRKAAVLIDMF